MSFQASALVALLAIESVLAFPFVADLPNVNKNALPVRSVTMKRAQSKDVNICHFNPSHAPAAPITSKYPYLGAINGKPGTGKGGIQVPAPGDTAHEFQAPAANDIRGPCPGLNSLANHGFIARSGIVSYNELVDAQQNVFNIAYDLANVLAIAGVGLDGDIVGTSLLSIGCGANSRTAEPGNVLADELGLDAHNQFEGDASLTRDDYFLADGDDYTWNSTLFTMMLNVCDGDCNLAAMAKYRYERYQQSVAENGNFFFSPGSLLLYGAASFLYELFAPNGPANPATMMSFFGATTNSKGEYVWNGGERIPAGFTNRVTPYDNNDVGTQIAEMYLAYPVAFGGNAGVNNFNGINYTSTVQDGKFNGTDSNDFMCLIFQTLADGYPEEIGKLVNLPTNVLNAMAAKIAPMAESQGCPINYTQR